MTRHPSMLADKVLDYFRANPDESLTRRDVAIKFGVHEKSVAATLSGLLLDGTLAQSGRGRRGSPVTYYAGPGLLEGAGAATSTDANPDPVRGIHGAPGAPIIAAPLIDRERHVLDYARIFLRDNDQTPTNEAIAGAFGFKSPNAASEIMLTLERKGHLARNELGWLMFARHSVGMWVLA